MKEEEIEKGDCGPPTRKVFFWFCRTWTKRYLITSQTRVKRVSRIHHRTILRMVRWCILRMVRWCIRLTRLTLVCEVIRYRLVQVRQNQKKKWVWVGNEGKFDTLYTFGMGVNIGNPESPGYSWQSARFIKSLNPIFRCATPSTGQIWKEKLSLVHCTVLYSWYTIVYQRQLLLSYLPCWWCSTPKYRIQTFCTSFSSHFWSIKSFETSECESRIVGRSPCYAKCQIDKRQVLISKMSVLIVASLRKKKKKRNRLEGKEETHSQLTLEEVHS